MKDTVNKEEASACHPWTEGGGVAPCTAGLTPLASCRPCMKWPTSKPSTRSKGT